jgi:CDP-diacylglycerol--glycerol-3-phosphate 3-phosphatidyltransferase
LYHTPALRGAWKRLMPDRYNETIGLQHCKIYIFDDTFVMSGANLSQVKHRRSRLILTHRIGRSLV